MMNRQTPTATLTKKPENPESIHEQTNENQKKKK
jgi:hypothetical protein